MSGMREFCRRLTCAGVASHTEEADLVRVQVSSGEGSKVSMASVSPGPFWTADPRSEKGGWGPAVPSSSLSSSRATRLGLQKRREWDGKGC